MVTKLGVKAVMVSFGATVTNQLCNWIATKLKSYDERAFLVEHFTGNTCSTGSLPSSMGTVSTSKRADTISVRSI